MNSKMISNTVQFGFPPGTPRPTWVEIAGFLKNLDCDSADMETVYRMEANRSLCIKYKSDAAMQDALRRNKEAIKFHYSSGKLVDLRMLPAGIDIHYVRVFDIPPEVSDEDLCSVLGNFGRIQRAVREKFPAGLGLDHLYTGVRGVYMEVANDIPPGLEISNWKAKIYYDGLKEKCFLCQLEGHRRNTCPKAKQTEKRKEVENRPMTYAGVVEVGAAVLLNGTENTDGDIIEIVDEEILERKARMEVTEKAESAPKGTTSKNTHGIDEESLKEIDQVAAQLGLENFSDNIVQIAELIDQIPNPSCSKDQASQRRAQFAASNSTEPRPKKSARKGTK